VGVAGEAKREEEHWDRAKMGAGVHSNLATPLPPSVGRGLVVVMDGGDAAPPDSASLVIKPQGAPPLPNQHKP